MQQNALFESFMSFKWDLKKNKHSMYVCVPYN